MKWPQGVLIALLLVVAALSLQEWPTPDAPPKESIEMVERRSDYYLETFDIDTLNNQGTLKHTLSGNSLTHYPHDDTAEIDALKLLVKRDNKSDWHVSSNTGWLASGATHVDLQGKVAMIREDGADDPGMTINSDTMRFDMEANTIATDSPVVIASEQWVANADGLRGNADTGDLTLLANVVFTYAPPQ